MNRLKKRPLVYGLITTMFIACQGEEGAIGPKGADGTNGLNSLVNIVNEPIGSSSCGNGGIKVEVGIDNNSNGALDINEILNISYICNGSDGKTSLTSVTTEPIGTNCENGGVRIDSGVDINGDGMLDNTEISSTAYVCNGINGSGGLVKTTSEPVGSNCENGGIKIDSGIDINGNGVLDENEITAFAYACSGLDGKKSLVNIKDEAPGANCENGGIKILSGLDEDGDKTLDEDEIQSTHYVCNGGNLPPSPVTELEFTFYSSGTTFSNSYQAIGELLNFDKNLYPDADSIIFTADLSANGSDAIASYADIFNSTDNVSIENSEISSSLNYANKVFIRSANLLSSFPNKEINISLRLRSDPGEPDASAAINKAKLIVYSSK